MEPVEFGVSAALTAGVVEAIKQAGVPSRFAPLVALVIGVGAIGLFTWPLAPDDVAWGLLAGLSAAGLYSGVKATTGR